ncbi:MAG TPA: hypothetical protein VN635_08090 [Conexibacter sp.]|nr:hypothetical protein [Conexibacter sp.]
MTGGVARNPFTITKATDLSDDQIESLWVDFQTDGGFYALADPTSPMPRMLLSGKGGGRTHLMRYFSAKLQLRRAQAEGRSVLDDGYVGVYTRLGGLNSGRFRGKGIGGEVWADVFAYALDLELAQRNLETAQTTFADVPALRERGGEIAASVAAVFDAYPGEPPRSIDELIDTIRGIRSELDLQVNNAAIQRKIKLLIRVTRGRLVFAVPQILVEAIAPQGAFTWLYLIDELENVTEEQQRYVQTLIREKEAPASLMLGSRLYGFRTRMTYSADEENKEGSEYTVFHPDETYVEQFSKFRRFCAHLVAQRLLESGYQAEQSRRRGASDSAARRTALAAELPRFFFEYQATRFGEAETRFVHDGGPPRHLARLASQLSAANIPETEARAIVEALAFDGYPLVEQLNTFLFQQVWSRSGRDLEAAASRIGEQGRAFVAGGASGRHAAAFREWRSDLLAQLLFAYERKQRYLGFDTFVRMAAGLPRHLVLILRNVYRAAEFNGESPFNDEPISEAAQRDGVIESANWFYDDAKPMGPIGEEVQEAVTRLADLFRALRLSDKPVEVGLTTFAVNASELTDAARETIRVATEWSMLIRWRKGRRDKNTRAVLDMYQLSPMLCPRWDLPLVRRGVTEFSGQEANAIFDPSCSGDFAAVHRARVARVTAPFRTERDPAAPQASLLGDG